MTLHQLPILILNPYGRCNCRCTMCDIWKNTESQALAVADLTRQMESLERLGVAWVVLSGGEPLMHPDLWELIAALRSRHIRISLLSSGLLLRRFAQQIVEQVDDVIVSLDGPSAVHDAIRGVPSSFDAIANGIEALRSLRADFPVTARCTVQRRNVGHLRATVVAAQELGFQSISFLAADLTSGAFNRADGWALEKQLSVGGLSSEELDCLAGEIETLNVYPQREFIREGPDKLRRIARHFRAFQRLEQSFAPACNAPWTSAVIEANGDVRPCFFHRPVGTLRSGLTLEAILNGPEAVAFRSTLDIATNPTCRQCVCSLDWKGVRA